MGKNKIFIPRKILEKKHVKEDKSIAQIAKELNLSQKVVYNRLKDYGLNRNCSKSAKISKHKLNCQCAICRDKNGCNNPMFDRKGILCPNYKDGRSSQTYFCIECGNLITWQCGFEGSGKCRSCCNLGQKRNEQTLKLLSKRMKEQWNEPEFRNKMLKLRKEFNKDTIVNHHIYLKENNNKTIKIKQGLHSSLHWRGYEYLVRIGLVNDYLKEFMIKYDINPNADDGKILHHKDCDRTNMASNNLMYLESRKIHSKLHQEAYSYLVRIDRIEEYINWFLSIGEKEPTKT